MSIAQRIHALLEQDPSAHPSTLATELAVSEWEVVRHLPAALMTQVPAGEAEALLANLASWGQVTTIVESDGSIFEVKAPFPKGKNARGYYNLMGRDGELHGHLKLDNVAGIALVSKLFMGKEGTPSSSSATVAAAFSRSTWAGTSSVNCCLSRWSVSWPCAVSIKRK